MSHTRKLARQRRKFFKEHPFCYYCKRKLILWEGPYRGKVPDNVATIEHLRPKMHPKRREPNPFWLYRHALACRPCNLKADQVFWRARSLEEKWRSAGQWPRMAYATGALPGEV